jgi:4-aminobutyrate aminotransferase-like enzyme
VLEQSAFQYFYDQSGATYLDCVNNVCQWGHCHPSIVRAAQKQMATLNTNSRYVYEQMAAFAERLTDTMPDGLDTVFFVNSGSEANDLAARLARAYTGNNDFVVVDRAYHGNSSLSTDLSPNRIDRPGRPGLPNYVRKTECPDLYRGRFRDDDPNAVQHYINDLGSVIDDMVAVDRSPAAFFAESLIGTGGQIVFPENYLASVYTKVRAAGGVCVADEVQVGFGRTGDHVWCFQSQGVTPDIVTMGKPIANGHPMAAVVTRREIAEAFDNGITYFNTFGGNPVSCAIGLACLDVLEQEELMTNTQAVSKALMTGLAELRAAHELIGDVRGLGLYIGVELVTDRQARLPATQAAKKIVESMKTQGVLVNTNGYDSNVLKIKPPMIIDHADVSHLLEAFESALSELSVCR